MINWLSIQIRNLCLEKKKRENNQEKSFTTKINNHSACGLSIFTHCSFHATKILKKINTDMKIVMKSFVDISESTQQK